MKKKLKIAIIGSRGYPFIYSGYETLIKELSEAMVKRGHNVRVYCHRSLFKKRPKKVNGIELIYIPSVETKLLSQFINSFLSFVHVCFSKYDIVFAVNSANGPFGILTRIFRKKTCINVDGLEWLRPKWKGIGSLYFKISSKMSTIFFDKVITDSFEMQKVYQMKFNSKSSVIAYGPSYVEKHKIINIKNIYDISPKKYYLIVGRLIPDNNSKLIIKSFLKTSSSRKLVIVGDDVFKDKYSQETKLLKNNKIVFTGYIKDQNKLISLYKNCFAYIHGHEFGGTNPTLVNALFYDCNILALNTKFNKEVLINNNFHFFKKELNDIINCIDNFERKKEKEFKNNFPNIYDWSYIIKKYEDIFMSL